MTSCPTYTHTRSGDIIITNAEYIMDIAPNNLLLNIVAILRINPGIPESFPMLSNFAKLFQLYEFEELVFRFKSTTTSGLAIAAGSMMMIPMYNPSSPPITTKRGLEIAPGRATGRVIEDLYCGFDCKRSPFGIKYVRSPDNMLTTDDINTLDMGYMEIATFGCPDELSIGELWVEYKVRLSKLRSPQPLTLRIGDGMFLTSTLAGGNQPNFQKRSVFGIDTGVIFNTTMDQGEVRRGTIVKFPLDWVPTITCGPSVLGNVTTVSVDFPIKSGDKFLLTLRYTGQSSFTGGIPVGTRIANPIIVATTGTLQASTIPYTTQASVRGTDHMTLYDQKFAQVLIIDYLMEFETAIDFTKFGKMQLHRQFTWINSTGTRYNSASNGSTMLSLTKVSNDFVLEASEVNFPVGLVTITDFSGKYLYAAIDGRILTQTTLTNQGKWTIEDVGGKALFKAWDGAYLLARPSTNSVALSIDPVEATQWTISPHKNANPTKGVVQIEAFNNTSVLGVWIPDSYALLKTTNNPLDWEEFIIRSILA